MTDYFALLDAPRRPWLDPDRVQEKFLKLSAQAHPDRAHGASEPEKEKANQRFSELNAASNCLREPAKRLLHLLELETGALPKELQQIAPDAMEFFLKVGQLCREVDAFLAQRNRVTAPVLKVEMFERAQEWIQKVNQLQSVLAARREALEAELKQLDAGWDRAPAAGPERAHALPLAAIERLWRDFSYLAKWSAQLQERVAQLSF